MAEVCDLFEEAAELDDEITSTIFAAGEFVEDAVLNDSTTHLIAQNIDEAAVIDDAVDQKGGIHIEESAVLDDAIEHGGTFVTNIVEAAVLNDGINATFAENIQESATINDEIGPHLVTSLIAEAAALNDAVVTSGTFANDISESAVLDDAVTGVPKTDISESAVLNDAVTVNTVVTDLIAESAVLNDAVISSGSVRFTNIDDSAILDDAVTHNYVAQTLVEDHAYIEDAVIGGGSYAWTAHVEPWAMSRFTNYPWNSMAVIDGVLFGAAEDGIYKLSGQDDDGVPISARVDHDWLSRTLNFRGELVANLHLKRPRYLYLNGVKADGGIEVMLGYVTNVGAEAESEYPLPELNATGFVNTRVPLGRGIRSRHLRPSIRNVGGAHFEYDSGYISVDSLARNL